MNLFVTFAAHCILNTNKKYISDTIHQTSLFCHQEKYKKHLKLSKDTVSNIIPLYHCSSNQIIMAWYQVNELLKTKKEWDPIEISQIFEFLRWQWYWRYCKMDLYIQHVKTFIILYLPQFIIHFLDLATSLVGNLCNTKFGKSLLDVLHP